MQWSVLLLPLPATSVLNSNTHLFRRGQSVGCLEFLMFDFWISCRGSTSLIWILDFFLLWTSLATLGCGDSTLLCTASTLTSIRSDANTVLAWPAFHWGRRGVWRLLMIVLTALAWLAGLLLLYAGKNRQAFLLMVERQMSIEQLWSWEEDINLA